MYKFRCPCCGTYTELPNVLRCPYCNKDLSNETEAYSKKHISRCAYHLNPYKYSDRRPGRPRKDEYNFPD